MVQDRLTRLKERWRALPPAGVDLAIALLVLAEGAIEVIASGAPDRAAGLGVVAVIAVGVLLRRRFPLIAVLVAFGGGVLYGQLSKQIGDSAGGPFFALLFVAFSMALRVSGRRLLLGATAVFALGSLMTFTDQYDDSPSVLVFVFLLMVAAPVGAGRLIRNRTLLNRALREKAERADAERARIAEAAVAEERTRIAGELHDVVAHALGAMTVQAAAARRLVERDHDRARDALLTVEETGREALTELRRLLGVLRREDEELALAPQPRLAYLRDLARRTSTAGLPTRVIIEGDAPDFMPAGVDLTGYRLVQEALTEALAVGHAGSAEVRVRYRGGTVEIDVDDDGRSPAPRTLLGMRERVRVYGGEMEAGQRPGSGYRLTARLPLEATP